MRRHAMCSRLTQSVPGAGNDLTDEITPIEAGLKWTIGKNRREKCDFLGGEVLALPDLCFVASVFRVIVRRLSSRCFTEHRSIAVRGKMLILPADHPQAVQ